MSPSIESPVVYSPYAYETHEDPYPTYARLRSEAPCYRHHELGFWALSRHADVAAGFRDSARLSSADGVTLDPLATGPHAHKSMSFLAMDPPRHTRMRSLVSRGFTPRRVNEMAERIRTLTLARLAPALDGEQLDLIEDLAGTLPMDVISEMIGVPSDDRHELRRLADLLVHRDEGVHDVPAAGIEAAFALAVYFDELIADRRADPADDLTSALIDAEIDGDRLEGGDILGFLILMVVAGNETTTKLLGNACWWAWSNPSVQAAIHAGEITIEDWVEETLRYDTSTQMLARTAAVDFEAHGEHVRAGDRVLLLVGSANRDDDVFSEASSYQPGRDTSASLSFGVGRHFCLGASLARLEAQICLAELVDRVASIDIDASRTRRVHSINVRGFASLPATVVPR